ncbi:putative bifunctional diguanylate cyclase/phosphodiesterase [Sulfurivermis fontis]|uniref:putative bifunctional diguanylate cyclase/phosphodiesterase n=1 Tax=Sulfurivermis fontis TaxID=1972068 RepID=UPI000FD71A4A|nr:bifunctional diguanylate cyclase/phosphodiesterase [Sulfurivermis fontis]
MSSLKTIKAFILTAALGVSLVLFLGMYLATTRVYDRAVNESAAALADTVAQGTFNAMYQIMRRGWTREQLEEFIGAIQSSAEDATYKVTIYRGALVSERFGTIQQPPIDPLVERTLFRGKPQSEEVPGGVRSARPLVARVECLRCHSNAKSGDVLGVITVHQELAPLVAKAKADLLLPLLLIAPLPFVVALGVALFLNRRINDSLAMLQGNIDTVNKVSDLTHIELQQVDLGFNELNTLFAKVEELAAKLRGVAVDKELLEFEIRLLEKFVITSEVVRDWREYVGYLMVDINKVIDAYTLFSIFKVDDELFDLDIFWIRPPSAATRAMMEESVRRILANSSQFSDVSTVTINHNIAQADGPEIVLDHAGIELQTKTLLVDTPKIGGIVGIGVHAALKRDEMRMLVIESILSTLLNVVGSVKAIYKYTKDLEFYATRDPLTNLYNQRLFWEMLGYEVSRAERHSYQFAVLVIDLDNFKAINDSYGHAFGDRFLQAFATSIHGALRTGDILARYGGDEFVVVLPESGAEQAYAVSERILANSADLSLQSPDLATVQATVSIGIAIYPEHAKDPKDLFLFADNMMYKAKTGGKNRIGFPTADDVVEVFRSIGEKSLIIANAITDKRVVPYFQPILDVSSNEVIAVEVLSRIHLEGAQVMGAHEFIEIAEKTGLIHKLDYVVMEKSFEQVQKTGYHGKIFVNLSPRALVLNEFIPEVKRLTTSYHIPPEQVVFEITERDTVKNITLLEQFVNDLKLEGFGLAIDDFGSGFSSFHYLKRFPIDYVKIEGDFIVNMINDPRDRAFVHSIADLAQQLGIQALAEFVENEEVLEHIRQAGIPYAQGYHIGHPSRDLPAVLARRAD